MPDELQLFYRTNESDYFRAAGFTLADVRRLYMRLWLRHTHEGWPAPDVSWTAEDDAALRACAAVVKEATDGR